MAALVPNPSLASPGDFAGLNLNPQNAEEFIAYCREEAAKWKLTKQTFTSSHQVYRGVDEQGIRTLAQNWRNNGMEEQARMLDKVVLIGDGMSSTVVMLDSNRAKKKSFIITARRLDGQYDVLTCECSQLKELDIKACAGATVACAGAGVGAGAILSLATGGVGGVVVIISLATTICTAATAVVQGVSEYNTPIVDQASAFMLTELLDSGIIKVVKGQLALVDANQNTVLRPGNTATRTI